MDVELFLFLLAFIYTLRRIPQKPGLQEIDRKANGIFLMDFLDGKCNFPARAVRPVGVEQKKRKPMGQIFREFVGDMAVLVSSGIESYR